ncbi:M20/M25/M40 family metallo-hydrolase [Dactylosporangium sp. NBC_01737]|uniref:M20/M25/M40 family metallo-hydrolase n=1 Tax=Dactylosporangium sp. NBC_01737 TaxID=2975959 RepID=UPI002E149F2E|nr:M20/M25/M40 family metallo-hydrolase [Dactylosporangium sp. NBC_01737]
MSLPQLRARRGRMTDDLAALVAVESPSADDTATAAGADAVTALGTALIGTAPERSGNHLLWRHGPTRVLLLGHHDTVWPVGTLARWPFSVTGDTATGPGCFDMKAGLVQLFHALSVLPSLDGVTVLVNADEEIGSPVSRTLIADAARGAAAALVCEPSLDGALKTARKGIARYRLEVTGRAAHTGLDPARGVNAGVELAHQTIAVAGLGHGDTTVTPTVMQAGTTENTVPAAASLAVDVRAFHDTEFDRVERAIHALRPVVPGSHLTVRGHRQRPALPASASTGLFRLACDVAADLGLPALTGAAVGGASDGNLTAGLGVPTLDGLGPVGGNAHADGEWVDLAAMGDRAALLAALVTRLLARPA